jgi:hypothetical protein
MMERDSKAEEEGALVALAVSAWQGSRAKCLQASVQILRFAVVYFVGEN